MRVFDLVCAAKPGDAHRRPKYCSDTQYQRRLPAYWYESRRRYFAVTFGIPCAMIIDLVAVAAHSFGKAKRFVRRQRHGDVGYFLTDLLQHSILWKRNRSIQAFRSRIKAAAASKR